MCAERTSSPPHLVHLVDSDAPPGRLRRVEFLRRAGDSCVVVGPLAGECRCAGFGLKSSGSALPRTIGPVLAGMAPGLDGPPMPCSWSYPVARRVAEVCERQVLVASAPPGVQARHDRTEGLHVLAPDPVIAEAWC